MKSSCRAFTLLEMMIAIAIFILLAGAVFEIFSSVLESVDILQDHQKRQNQIMALQAYLDLKMRNLTIKDQIFSWPRSEGDAVRGLGWIQDDSMTLVYTAPQPNGLSQLMYSQFQMAKDRSVDSYMGNDFQPDGVALIHDLKTVTLRFQGLNKPDWDDHLQGVASQSVSLIEMSLLLGGDKHPITFDFWRPFASNSVPGDQGLAPPPPPPHPTANP